MSMLSDPARGLSRLEQISVLLKTPQPPIRRALDIALISVGEGVVSVEGRPDGRHRKPAGVFHGGYVGYRMRLCGTRSSAGRSRLYDVEISGHQENKPTVITAQSIVVARQPKVTIATGVSDPFFG